MRSKGAPALALLLRATPALLLVALLDPVPSAAARTWNVPGEVPTIQAAIDSAVAGDTVLVAPGTYSESPKATAFGPSMLIMKFRVDLLSSGGPALTTLDALGQGRVVFYPFFSQGSAEARIEGFTITGASPFGAVLCETGSLTIAECAITGNASIGAWAGTGSNLRLVSCSVTSNSGGGVALCQCDLVGSQLTVEFCDVSGNTGDGVASIGDGPSLSVRASSVSRNSGCGINSDVFGSAFVNGCTIVGNSQAGIAGVGVASQIWNTIISHTASGPGIDCPFGDPIIICCDVWGNAGGDAICGASSSGNFSLNPLFCGVDAGDYTLQANSPCLPGNHPQNETCGLIGAFGEGCETILTSVGTGGATPAAPIALGAPAPNPSDRGFAFEVRLAQGGAARVRVYDAGGRFVRAIWEGALAAGAHPLEWDARDSRGLPVASGVYVLRLEAGGRVEARAVSVIH